MLIEKTFGNILKLARKRRSYTQQELAEKLGVTKSYISKLEGDRYDTPPSQKLIEAIALFCDYNKEHLAVLAGRIPQEDWQIYVELYQQYGDRFSDLLRKMYSDPDFAQKIISNQ